MNSRIYFGDSRDVLSTLEEEFGEEVALMVTSPPYYVGRGYENYLGSWGEYWKMLSHVLTDLTPLMEPFGKVAINFADKYANSKDYGRPLEIAYVPGYQRIMEIDNTFDLWARIVWDKVRVMIDGARHTTNKGRFTGSMRVAPNWEYIFVWRKRGDGRPPEKELDMTYEEWREWVNGIWRFSSVSRNAKVGDTKLAIFPKELPNRLIKMYTQPGDVVLDPFAGTGTTIKAALELGRIGIGIERNIDMLPLIQEKLGGYSKSCKTIGRVIVEV